MKKILSIIVLSSLFTVTAAQQQPMQLIQCNDGQKIELSIEICNRFEILKTMMKDSVVDVLVDGIDIIPIIDCSRTTLENLINFTGLQGQADRSAFLRTLSQEQLITIVKGANYLDLNNETDAYTDLIEYALRCLNEEELKSLLFIIDANVYGIERWNVLDDGFLDYEATQKALKRMQLVANAYASVDFHNLASPYNLGFEKVTLLKEAGLWNFTISPLDLYNNPGTRHVFVSTSPLQSLNLQHYSINSLDGLDKIPGLSGITNLNLKSNKFKKLEATAFACLPQLEILNLSHNKITELDDKTFSVIPQLKTLSIEGNQLTTLNMDIFKELPQLEFCWFDNNLIERITYTTFYKNSNLISIRLTNNRLTSLNSDFFKRLPQLEVINLSDNPLTERALVQIKNDKPRVCRVFFNNDLLFS